MGFFFQVKSQNHTSSELTSSNPKEFWFSLGIHFFSINLRFSFFLSSPFKSCQATQPFLLFYIAKLNAPTISPPQDPSFHTPARDSEIWAEDIFQAQTCLTLHPTVHKDSAITWASSNHFSFLPPPLPTLPPSLAYCFQQHYSRKRFHILWAFYPKIILLGERIGLFAAVFLIAISVCISNILQPPL